MAQYASSTADFLTHSEVLGLANLPSGDLTSFSPIDGKPLAQVSTLPASECETLCTRSAGAFEQWRTIPAPLRGRLVKTLGDVLIEHKEPLAQLVTLEVGKSIAEARGEVQEMIDICEFAVGLSRQLHGLTIASERPQHHLLERYHPLGPVLVISAFNFPVAVWSWNTALALVCGNSVVWKPSEIAPLCALACQHIFQIACERADVEVPEHLHQLAIGGADVGRTLVDAEAFALVSATGSTAMGSQVGSRVVQRFGKVILELGGNNAAIVSATADLGLASQACAFSAAGTAGQRCTTLRRAFVQREILPEFREALVEQWSGISCGDPRQPDVMAGPLIHEGSLNSFNAAIAAAQKEGGRLIAGGTEFDCVPGGRYVSPAVIEVDAPIECMMQETFAPILYLAPYDDIEEAITLNNSALHGLSSCIFSNDVRETELFLSATGSDCGIANVNIGTSGAEIGGAFGGEKHSGTGRESGSDAWKQYMRRQTQTINYSPSLTLAQGITFDKD